MAEEILTEKERLRNVSAWNEALKELTALELNYERERVALKNRKKVIVEVRNRLLGGHADMFDSDTMPLITENPESITQAGVVEVPVDLDSGAQTFRIIEAVSRERHTPEEHRAFMDYFVSEASLYEHQ